MKKIFFAALLACLTAISASASSIDDFWTKVKQSSTFSTMEVPKEDALSEGFYEANIAMSETVSATALDELNAQLALIPATQLLSEINDNKSFVKIYSAPLAGDKAQILFVIINKDSKQGVIFKGITSQENINNQLKDFHLNNMFGK